MSSILNVSNLSALSVDNNLILDKISFNLLKGKNLFVLGKNGAGKSSLLKAILKQIVVKQGDIFLQNKNLFRIKEKIKFRCIQYIPQDLSSLIFQDLSVYENCLIASEFNKTKLERVFSYVETMNKHVLKVLKNPVSSLSGGEKQILSLALCFSKRPKVILLDEFTSALDVIIKEKVLAFVETHIYKNQELSSVTVSHTIEDAIEKADMLIVLKKGKMSYMKENIDRDKMTAQKILSYF